jgi:hypothetical protein
MKGHMCIMNNGKVVNKKNHWLTCELEERLTKGDVGSSMALRVVIWEANCNPTRLGLPSSTLALQFNGPINWETKSSVLYE